MVSGFKKNTNKIKTMAILSECNGLKKRNFCNFSAKAENLSVFCQAHERSYLFGLEMYFYKLESHRNMTLVK